MILGILNGTSKLLFIYLSVYLLHNFLRTPNHTLRYPGWETIVWTVFGFHIYWIIWVQIKLNFSNEKQFAKCLSFNSQRFLTFWSLPNPKYHAYWLSATTYSLYFHLPFIPGCGLPLRNLRTRHALARGIGLFWGILSSWFNTSFKYILVVNVMNYFLKNT